MAEHAAASNISADALGQSVIPIMNKLHDIFARLGRQSTIELPQVAVIGSQSSGKSSVLEALVGRDFLPRGSDICTRRPLLLQLIRRSRNDDGTDEEWGEFSHLPGQKFFDFSEIRKEIQAETDREAGGNKGISDKQIQLKIFSPNVLDITLVDLPGLTKVPVGDQPSDIEARVTTMIMSYIMDQSRLILAVTPANSDLANSDALRMAAIADPNGDRTIGVITKVDIMDRGTDARNLLLGKVIPLQFGYVGVVNRSQEDILLNRNIKDALIAEKKFFDSWPVYSDLADCCGIPQLAKKLNQILIQHIKMVLPRLKAHISAQLVSVAKENASYGDINESKASQGALLLTILSKYAQAFSAMIDGKNEEMLTSELSGGARIHYIFQNIFVKCLECIDPCENLTDDDICIAIHNASGLKSGLFVPELPFEVLVRRQIARLLDPSLKCARFVYDELIKMSRCCMAKELRQFPVLKKYMDEVVGNLLLEGLKPLETMIGHIIEMEMDYINTSHPNFIGGSKAVEFVLQQPKSSRIASFISRQKDTGDSQKAPNSERSFRAMLGRQTNAAIPDQAVLSADDVEKTAPPVSSAGLTWRITSIFGGHDNSTSVKENSTSKQCNEPVQHIEQGLSTIDLREAPSVLRLTGAHSEEESIEIAVTRELLRSYYDIVRKNIEDFIPKAIVHFLVNQAKRELHNLFIKKLYRENLFEEMLQEPDEFTVKRKNTRDALHVLQQAYRILDELPLEVDIVERNYNLSNDRTCLPETRVLPTSTLYNTRSSSTESFRAWPQKPKRPPSTELYLPDCGDANGVKRSCMSSLYPTVGIKVCEECSRASISWARSEDGSL